MDVVVTRGQLLDSLGCETGAVPVTSSSNSPEVDQESWFFGSGDKERGDVSFVVMVWWQQSKVG